MDEKFAAILALFLNVELDFLVGGEDLVLGAVLAEVLDYPVSLVCADVPVVDLAYL